LAGSAHGNPERRIQPTFMQNEELGSCTRRFFNVETQDSNGASVQPVRPIKDMRCAMKKTLIAIAAAATVALVSVAAPQPAQARGGRIAAGIIGGLALGGILGAAAAHGPYYGPGPYYYGRPAYYGPECYWTRQRFWDGYGWRLGRPIRVCD
jgi:hypothetical protein